MLNLNADNRQAVEEQPELLWLKDKLLSLGGRSVRLVYEQDLDLLQSRGRVWHRSRVEPGPYPEWCHASAAAAYAADPRHRRLATGWALGPTGIWVQHSWSVDRQTVVEPTPIPRSLYFGFLMTDEEAQNFLDSVERPSRR